MGGFGECYVPCLASHDENEFMRKLRLLLYHFSLLPRLFSTYLALRKISIHTRLFCFFPFYQTGGSERVHADILESIHTERRPHEVATFFTKVSRSSTFKSHFQTVGHCFEIAPLDRSKFRGLLIKTMARAINRAHAPTVFGANATLMYELIPYLHKSVRIVDLTHSFVPESDNPVERASLPYVDRLAARVVISRKTKEDYEALYRAEGVPDKALSNIHLVHNRLNYPPWDLAQKVYNVLPLRALFVGRNSPEKRIGLIARIAHALRDEPVKFTFVGANLEQSAAFVHRSNLYFTGEVTDPLALARIYQAHHVILITSRREGFPLVLAEGMAHGAVPVSTDVGGISDHVQDGENGFLIDNCEDESVIVQAFVARLRYLAEHPEIASQLGKAAQTEAYRSFDPEVFNEKWKELLIG